MTGSDNVWWWIYTTGQECIEKQKLREAQLIGTFLLDFGQNRPEKIRYCGKNLLASALTYSKDPTDLFKAKQIFEEITNFSVEWYNAFFSKQHYEILLNKLKDRGPGKEL